MSKDERPVYRRLGQVVEFDSESGMKNSREWTKFVVKDELGLRYHTFRQAVANQAADAYATKRDHGIYWRETPYGRELAAVKEIVRAP